MEEKKTEDHGPEEERKMQQLQLLEQNLQNLLLQKQAFQIEQRETQAALRELEKSGDEVFKVIGQLMIKTDKDKMKKELEEKVKLIDLRIQNMDKQEQSFSERFQELQKDLLG